MTIFLLTKEQQINKLHKQLDQQKEYISKMDEELLDHIEDQDIVHLSYVYLDKRYNSVRLSGAKCDGSFECVMYNGGSREVAEQIVNSLYYTFDIGYGFFDEDGVYMQSKEASKI
ncbi:hypothetical protein EEL31_23785 [Brevibacillus laterosporus]|nr:hypothetical protein [Brevibacillus laterosporus]TPG71153.1 hypothetical protein EEL31_23785 [Brevibacillus laterosporus]